MSARTDCIREAAARLRRAVRPVVLIGPEAAGSVSELLQLADALEALVLTTPDGLSLVDGKRSAGVFSFGASARARQVAERADVVVAASALGEFSSRMGSAFTNAHVIQLLESVAEASSAREPDALLVGPLAANAKRLLAALAAPLRRVRPAWAGVESANDNADPPALEPDRMDPAAAMRALRGALPAGVRLCLDVTSASLHAYRELETGPLDRVFSSIERSACMGEALLASIGIRLASGAPTLALVGDWCFCMVPDELHTAVELGLDRYVIVAWANRGGAFIGAGVKQQGIRVPEAAWRWQKPPDLARVAEGLGARGVVVTDAAGLGREVAAGLAGDRPVLIEARIDPDAEVPAGDRFLALGLERS